MVRKAQNKPDEEAASRGRQAELSLLTSLSKKMQYVLILLVGLTVLTLITAAVLLILKPQFLTKKQTQYVNDQANKAAEKIAANDAVGAEQGLVTEIGKAKDKEVRRALRINLGLIYEQQDKIKEAINVYEQSIREDGSPIYSLAEALAQAYENDSQFQQANFYFIEALNIYSKRDEADKDSALVDYLEQAVLRTGLKAN